jgi:hypothetical protein
MDPDFALIELPAPLIVELSRRMKALGVVGLQDLVLMVLEQWVAAGGKDPRKATETEHQQEVQFNEQYAHLLACALFMESIPNEICIKKSDQTLVWGNRWYRNMAGGRDLPDLVGKSPAEIWKDDVERAEKIKKWDRQVLEKRAPIYHIDSIRYADDLEPRARVGIRFPMVADPTAEIKFIGTIGIDFRTLADAEAACDAIRTEGEWDVRKKIERV